MKRRIAIGAGLVSIFIGVGAFGTVKEQPAPPARELVVESLAVQPLSAMEDFAQTYWHETHFERGDTFSSMLHRLEVDGRDIAKLLKQNGGAKPFRNLRPGMTVQAQTDDDGSLLALRFTSSADDVVLGFDREGERFRMVEEAVTPSRQVFIRSGEIHGSLFAAADAADMPESVIMQFADIFSGDVDFHRDLRNGDRFAVAYEVLYYNGQPLRAGRVLAAEFVNDTRTYRTVWFVDESGKGGYYSSEGTNLRKAFLRSPLEFSRITSGFAMRTHPIQDEWRAHKGVDYGAPAGTRVRATADGTVEFVGQQNGYGNVVVLKHRAGITTLYAHLSGFAKGMHSGMDVHQGDIIGFVGATGWATGPHLHYEFRVHDQHRNPLTVAVAPADPVSPHLMPAFRAEAQPLLRQLGRAAEEVKLAAIP